MTLASSSKTQLSFLEEQTFNVVDQVGTPRLLRVTGESLKHAFTKAGSNEMNSTRQSPDASNVSAAVDGGIDIEVLYREYDDLLEALLASTYTEAFAAGGLISMTVDFSVSGSTITDTGATGFGDLAVGDWFAVQGAGVNSKFYKVSAISADPYLVVTVDAATPVVADATGVTCDVSSSRMMNGTAALRTFSIQKLFSDVGQYFIYRGMGVNTLELSFETGKLLTGSFGFLGASSARDTATFFGSAPTAATSFGTMSPVGGVGSILIDGAALSGTYVKKANLSISAALRGQDALGVLGNIGIGEGTYAMSGNLTIYLNDGSLYDTAIADTAVSIELPIMDAAGNGYVLVFDNAKLAVPDVPAGGKDTDVMLSFDFTAHAPNMTSDRMLAVYRLGAAS